MKYNKSLIAILSLVALFSSCKVDFSPNAPWRDVPSVYCVLDAQEDTVWARVQRCYLGEDNLYSYAGIADSNNYPEGDIQVHLLAWLGQRGEQHSLTPTNRLVDRWELTYTLRSGKPEGSFSNGPQPVYYCVPGRKLLADTGCVFQLVVIRTSDGDTIAQAFTTMVGLLRPHIDGRDTTEKVLISPNDARGHEFGFRIGCRGEIKWYSLPRGRLYQPILTFYYKKKGDTLSVNIPGTPFKDVNNASTLASRTITQDRFLSTIKNALSSNTDTLYNVNNVDINIAVCNEDLNAYITSQDRTVVSGQDYHTYTNIQGGVGIFGSRRSHIIINVPCDSVGKEGYIPAQLKDLGVGFYGQFSEH